MAAPKTTKPDDPAVLLDYLTRVQGIHVTIDPADSSRLKISPWSTLDGDTQLTIRRHKLAFLAILRRADRQPVVVQDRLVLGPWGVRTLVACRDDGIVITTDTTGRTQATVAWVLSDEQGQPLAAPPGRRPPIGDPRPDLEADSGLWQQVLAALADVDGLATDGTYATMHGARCLGARLQLEGNGWSLETAEMDADDAADVQRRLLDHRLVLVETLQPLRERSIP